MKILKQLRFYLLVLFAALLIYFGLQIKSFGLPQKYLILVALAFTSIFFLMVALCYQRSKVVRWLGIILIVVSSVGVQYGNGMIKDTMDTLSAMEENSNKQQYVYYSVVSSHIYDTENGEMVPRLSTINAEKYGILEMGNTTYARDAIAAVREDAGKKVDFVGIKSFDEAAEKLQSGEIEMLVFNEAIRDLFETDLNTISTTIKTYEFEDNKESIRNPAKVTQEPFAVYVSGIDLFGSLSYVSRSDVNKLLIINPLSKDVLMIDIPRDYYVPLSCFYNEYDKLTHTGIYGVDCTVNTVSNFLDIDINYYARINFSTFIEVIDAIGGVDIDFEEGWCASEDAGGYCYHDGVNHLSGYPALCFARERQTLPGGDNDRIKNQSKLLKALIDKVANPSILNNYNELLDILAKNIETNMSTQDMISLIKMQLSDMASWSIESYALDGWGTYDMSAVMGQELYVCEPDYDTVAKAKELIEDVMSRVY